MGITSGILWIVFGVLYILYQALKEHPAEVTEGLMKSAALIFGMLCGNFLVRWAIGIDELWGSIASVIFVFTLLWFEIRKEKRETRMYEEQIAEYERMMREMDEHETSICNIEQSASGGCAGKG